MPELGDMSEEVCRDLLRAPGFADKLGSVNLVLRLEQLVFDCSIGTCKVTRVLGSTKGHGSPPSNGRSKWLRFERKDSGAAGPGQSINARRKVSPGEIGLGEPGGGVEVVDGFLIAGLLNSTRQVRLTGRGIFYIDLILWSIGLIVVASLNECRAGSIIWMVFI